MAPTLHPLDLAIIGAYLLAIVAVTIRVARRDATEEDFFLGGRSFGFWAVGLSLFASNISSTSLVGLSGAAYRGGIAVSNYHWMAALALVGMCYVWIPLFLRNRITTIPEFLEFRFGRVSRLYFSATTLLINVLVDLAGGMYAGAIVLKVFAPDVSLTVICCCLALFAGIYTTIGGMRAVVYTDMIQAVLLLIGCATITWFVYAAFDFSWTKATTDLPPEQLHFFKPIDDPGLPWLGTLMGLPVLGLYYWGTNQFITQRVLAARSVEHARWGSLFAASLKLLPLAIIILPATMARNLYPLGSLEHTDQLFPKLVSDLLPAGAVGLVLIGLISAVLSSLDSALNSAATLIVHDFVHPVRPDISSQSLARIGRATTATLMIVAAMWAPFIENFSGLFNYLQAVFSYIVPPFVVLFVIGAFWRRGDDRSAVATLIVGHAVSLPVFILANNQYITLHFTILAGILTLICSVMYVVFSWGRIPTADIDRTIWARDVLASTSTRWYQDYRWLSAAIVTLILVVVFCFA